MRKSGTRKLAAPHGGMAQVLSPAEVVRSPCASKSSQGRSCAALRAATSATTEASRPAPPREIRSCRRNPARKTPSTISHVKMIISGEPVVIWHAPASAARTTRRLPPLHAPSASNTTHGIQPSARDVAGPHPAIQRQPVPGEYQAGEARGHTVAEPAQRQKIHSDSRQKNMPQNKKVHRPRHGQQFVKERRRIQRQRVPLREKGNAAIVVRIPQRNRAPPEAIPQMISHRKPELPRIAVKKSVRAEHDVRIRNQQEHAQQQRQARGGELPVEVRAPTGGVRVHGSRPCCHLRGAL